MRRRGRALIAASTLLLAGCGGAAPVRELQDVTAAGGGRYWAAGSAGAAVFYDGTRLVARDYPMDSDKPDWAYEPGTGFPAAQIRIVDGTPLLLTRGGDVLSWSAGGWVVHDVRFPVEHAGDPPLLDQVVVLPGGRLVVQLHSHTLLRATPGDLFAGRFEIERTPTFFTHLSAVDDRVYALGWDQTGNVRALWASMPRSGFSLVGRLGVEENPNSMRGLLVLDDGTPVGVATSGIVPLGQSPEVSALGAWVGSTAPGAARIPREGAGRYISALFAAERGRALFVLGGGARAHDVVALEAGRAVGYRCAPALDTPIGAFPHAGGWRLVDRQGTPRDFPGPSCRPALQIAH